MMERVSVWEKANPTPSKRKQAAVVKDARSRSVAIANVAVIAELMNANRARPIAMHRRAQPLKTKHVAVVRCIGARLGV
jgi:hypothetical protein